MISVNKNDNDNAEVSRLAVEMKMTKHKFSKVLKFLYTR